MSWKSYKRRWNLRKNYGEKKKLEEEISEIDLTNAKVSQLQKNAEKDAEKERYRLEQLMLEEERASKVELRKKEEEILEERLRHSKARHARRENNPEKYMKVRAAAYANAKK